MLPESPGREGPLGSIALTTLLRDTAPRRARESPRRGEKGAFVREEALRRSHLVNQISAGN